MASYPARFLQGIGESFALLWMKLHLVLKNKSIDVIMDYVMVRVTLQRAISVPSGTQENTSLIKITNNMIPNIEP